MHVLVTGASSLIGQGLVRVLTSRGDAVVGFQRTPNPDGTTKVVAGDIRDVAALDAAAGGCDAIVHLAARVGVVGDWEAFRSVNVDGTANVIEAARRQGISRVVHVSSPSVAHGGEPISGAPAAPPVTGRRGAFYAESKAVGELHAVEACTADLGVVVIRPHLVWGPGDTQLVGRIVDRARHGRLALVGGGHALVDTTYVDNAVDALVAALDAVSPGARCAGRAYVVANGEPRPIRELIEGICVAAGVEFAPRDIPLAAARRVGALIERTWPRLPERIRAGEPEPPLTRFVAEQLGTAHWFDPRPARDDLGWTPTVSIDQGLVRLARWFDEDT